MPKIVVSADMLTRLRKVTLPADLCDENGSVLGQFVPAFDPSKHEPLESQISRTEMDRRKQSKERRYTSEEVLAQLEKLRCGE